jgi:hypothetical protein
MDQGPLVSDQANAGEELIRRLNPSFPVKAAFWLKDSEGGPWYLYIASDEINDKTLDAAYAEVLRLADEVANPYLDAFQVKLIPASDPRAQAALAIYRQDPGILATRFLSRDFDRMGLSEVYLYPASVTAPAS